MKILDVLKAGFCVLLTCVIIAVIAIPSLMSNPLWYVAMAAGLGGTVGTIAYETHKYHKEAEERQKLREEHSLLENFDEQLTESEQKTQEVNKAKIQTKVEQKQDEEEKTL